MRAVAFEVEEETYEEQSAAGRYNPGLVVLFRDKYGRQRFPISAGTRDDIYVYREKDAIYVLSVNYGLNYVGLQILLSSPDGPEEIGEMFLDSDESIEVVLGRRGLDLMPATIIRYMREHIY